MEASELEERADYLEFEAERAFQAGEVDDARELEIEAEELRQRAEELRS